MIKIGMWIACIGVLAYAGICLVLYLRQRTLIYYPHPPVQSKAADVYWLENGSVRLKIWQVVRETGTALIYFGGNAEDVSLNLAHFTALFPDVSIYLMNYRGYGGSTGSPSEQGIGADGRALFDHVAATHGKIVVMGRSLGTGVALRLAAERPVDGLMLVTPYSSMTDLARHYYPLLPVGPLLKDRFDSTLLAPEIDIPVLVLIAEGDEVIPRTISDALAERFRPGVAQAIVIEGTGHNSIESGPGYDTHLAEFVSSIVSGTR